MHTAPALDTCGWGSRNKRVCSNERGNTFGFSVDAQSIPAAMTPATVQIVWFFSFNRGLGFAGLVEQL